ASGMMEPSTACASDLGFTLVLMGELRRGLATMRDADSGADATGHPPTIIYATSNMLRIGMILEDRAILAAVAAKMGELGERLGAPRFSAYALMAEGWSRMQDGNEEGIAMFREGHDIMLSYGHHTYTPYSAAQLAAAWLRLGQVERARRVLNEGFELLDRSGARWCEAELHRLQGELAAAPNRGRRKVARAGAAEAAASYRRSIEVASLQGARWWEVRACFRLAALLPAVERAEATRRLAELHAGLDDGSDVAELHAVRAFLAQAKNNPLLSKEGARGRSSPY
ncbi:MAG TPA: hypothetical protein VEB21_17110, partial [Terriglobales bacterium]|nr:hypothetical protein [Terriglobales bacterium]